jgi:16S rRNA (uracil1498-N3)-methyltransferase
MRFFLPPDAWVSDVALLGEEAKHCAQVLRSSRGDMVEVFDGAGRRARATILSVAKSRVSLGLEVCPPAQVLTPRITLFQAIPKGKTMDLIVQKAVELGVAVIQPVLTRHTVVRLEPGEAQRKAEKWQRVALEACKQCGQDTLPVVRLPMSLAEALAGASPASIRVLASLAPGARPLRELLRGQIPECVDVLVGPEGDFSPEETSAALAAGFLAATLGSIVLRAETAAFFALGALRYEFGEA